MARTWCARRLCTTLSSLDEQQTGIPWNPYGSNPANCHEILKNDSTYFTVCSSLVLKYIGYRSQASTFSMTKGTPFPTPGKSGVRKRRAPLGPGAGTVTSNFRSTISLFFYVGQGSYIYGHLRTLDKVVRELVIPTTRTLILRIAL